MKFRFKMMLSMLCLLALLFGAGGSLLIALSFESSLDREETATRESYQTILDTMAAVSALGAWTTSEDASSLLDQLYADSASSWSALRFASDQGIQYKSGSSDLAFVDDRAGIDAGHSVLFSLSDNAGARYLQLSGACMVNDELFYLDALHDLSPLYEARAHQQTVFRVVFLALVICCAGLAYGMSWLLTRPLSHLSKASQELASGNLAFRSNVRTNDEIGTLSTDFDAMASQVERSVTDMKHSLEQQERFMGSFVHEVKTPMTAIIGYADLLRRGMLEPAEQKEAARYLFSEGKRLENLSLKLLDIFVMGKTDLSLTVESPSMLIHDAVAGVQTQYEGTNCVIVCKCEEGACLLDADLVRSLVLNLVENACKAVKASGTVVVSCTLQDDGCHIQVEDNGKGIPAEALQHLTEAFYRVDTARSRAEGGAGLGLALCAKIAELHHGSLTVESELDHGTRVTVNLRGGCL